MSAQFDAPRIVIDRLGHLGDGIGAGAEGAVHVPLAAPGDVFARDPTVETGWRLIEAGKARAEPPCRHFGVCGGCNLQHVSVELYAQSKREWVIAALENQGLRPVVDALVPAAPGTRRRASFAAIGRKDGALIGFHRARSHEIIEVPHCLVVRPRMIKALAAVRDMLTERLGPGR